MEKYLKIPPEIWLKVFENLTVRDLCQVMLVSDLYHIIIYAIYALTGVARLERDWKYWHNSQISEDIRKLNMNWGLTGNSGFDVIFQVSEIGIS